MRRHYVPVRVLVLLAIVASSCSKSSTSPSSSTPTSSLTPARSIAGVWSTDAPVTFIYQTSFCGARTDVARALWHVSWTITPVSGYTNVVEVEMRLNRGSAAAIGPCQPNGWVPVVSPTFFKLCVSASSVTRCNEESYPDGYAYGSFTTNLMELTWTHWYCIIYCSGEVTEANQLKMTKKS